MPSILVFTLGGGVTKPQLKDYSQDVLTDLRVKKEVRLVEKYVNGNSGYRLYSDGYCEQWGLCKTKATVKYLKPFANTSYSIQATPSGSTADAYENICCTSQKVGSCLIALATYTHSVNVKWKATGYIK